MNDIDEEEISLVIRFVLPKNKLGADLFRNLYVFADSDHKFEAQKPSSIDLNKVN